MYLHFMLCDIYRLAIISNARMRGQRKPVILYQRFVKQLRLQSRTSTGSCQL